MILGALNAYYERLLERGTPGLSRPGFSQQKISFALMLDASGQVAEVIDLRDTSGKTPQPRMISVPQPPKRSSNVEPATLWDKTSYALGVSASSKRVVQEHAAFKDRHFKLLEGQEDAGLRALLRFLQQWSPDAFAGHPLFPAEMLDANIVFGLDGERAFLHERPAALALLGRSQNDGQAETHGFCLVTGRHLPLARLHPSIKGVKDAQPAGASIVSFNLAAFTSYGKEQGENAPISEQAAFGYTTALNHLLRRDEGNRQRMQIGDATVVFWAEADDAAQAEAAEGLFASLLDPKADDATETQLLRYALEPVSRMQAVPDLAPGLDPGTRMYVLGLAPNASRLSIRYWMQDDLGQFARRLSEHFDDLRLEPSPWLRQPSLKRLLQVTAPYYNGKAKDDDVPPHLAGEFSRAVLTGGRYPQALLNIVLMRLRSDAKSDMRTFSYRIALCKAVIARNRRLQPRNQKIDLNTDDRSVPVSLDLANKEPGYVLGRLFSTLEYVQREALGKDINATIRDRYFGAASATPGMVFPLLLRNAQHHLNRLGKDRGKKAGFLQSEIGKIIALLKPEFPRSLSLEAQGHFAIGYYHQTQARFARKDDAPADEDDTQDDTTDTAGEPA